jgi:glycosyltransferase involved in cell wall biosynthesis
MPFMYTGDTAGVDLKAQGFFAQVREALESPLCLRIFSHMRSSLEILNRVFDSPAIAQKCQHVPLGIQAHAADAALAKYQPGERLRILFTNSLHQNPHSFYLRGGHHVLEAFGQLRQRLPDAELTVLSSVPADLTQRFSASQLVGVNWINARVDEATLERLFLDHHVFALPAAGLHSYSLLRALAHGCVPIVSDALGYEEYTRGIEASVLTVRGVRDLVYRDEPAGWVSDCYTGVAASSESFVRQILDQLLANARMPHLRDWAHRNLEHCRRHFSLGESQAAFNRLLPGH